MGKLTPSLAAETEALREAYAALNRNEIPASVKAFDSQIEDCQRRRCRMSRYGRHRRQA